METRPQTNVKGVGLLSSLARLLWRVRGRSRAVLRAGEGATRRAARSGSRRAGERSAPTSAAPVSVANKRPPGADVGAQPGSMPGTKACRTPGRTPIASYLYGKEHKSSPARAYGKEHTFLRQRAQRKEHTPTAKSTPLSDGRITCITRGPLLAGQHLADSTDRHAHVFRDSAQGEAVFAHADYL